MRKIELYQIADGRKFDTRELATRAADAVISDKVFAISSSLQKLDGKVTSYVVYIMNNLHKFEELSSLVKDCATLEGDEGGNQNDIP